MLPLQTSRAMHQTLATRCLIRALRIGEASSPAALPVFLCPAISGAATAAVTRTRIALPRTCGLQHRKFHAGGLKSVEAAQGSAADDAPSTPELLPPAPPPRKLPVNCTGCGAFSQTHDPKQFGFYSVDNKRVRDWISHVEPEPPKRLSKEDQVVDDILKSLGSNKLEAMGIDPATLLPGESVGESSGQNDELPAPNSGSEKPPVCDRCHNLLHHGMSGSTTDIPMYHPTVEALRETIEESPHKYNHIYHVIDAADFPMSLIPRLNVLLGDIPLRTRNRRSRAGKFIQDRQVEMSFVITRGDLLGPTKASVDNMMPYLREVIRDALGRLGGRIRLGNLRCVSAKRGWWTKNLKEDIWKRGGAGWMVGKVNVGKSQLFEAVYPKGRVSSKSSSEHQVSVFPREESPAQEEEHEEPEELDVGDLLPPSQPTKQYPDMPIVSSLPGTTASPIRIPFGNKKGELIDLPGLARSDLDLFVKPEHRKNMIMSSRIIPQQLSVSSTDSVLLGGGLVRITPRTPNMRFLMYNFTPLKEHLTNTEKATDFQNQTRVSQGLENITLPGVGEKIQHAGTFKLCHDVTKKRAGPLTRKSAVGLKVENLPFRVLSVDILIEGVGYVEIVAQVRAKDLRPSPAPEDAEERAVAPPEEEVDSDTKATDDPFAVMMSNRRSNKPSKAEPTKTAAPVKTKDPSSTEYSNMEPLWPAVDVFTPEGRFIGSRRPIEGWMNNKPRVRPEHKKSRPRKSMRGQKKTEKRERRATAADAAAT